VRTTGDKTAKSGFGGDGGREKEAARRELIKRELLTDHALASKSGRGGAT